jgi:hypothetical protein
MKLGTISPKRKIHGVIGNSKTACGCGTAKDKVWNGKRAEITCLRCNHMTLYRK